MVRLFPNGHYSNSKPADPPGSAARRHMELCEERIAFSNATGGATRARHCISLAASPTRGCFTAFPLRHHLLKHDRFRPSFHHAASPPRDSKSTHRPGCCVGAGAKNLTCSVLGVLTLELPLLHRAQACSAAATKPPTPKRTWPSCAKHLCKAPSLLFSAFPTPRPACRPLTSSRVPLWPCPFGLAGRRAAACGAGRQVDRAAAGPHRHLGLHGLRLPVTPAPTSNTSLLKTQG